MEFHACQLPFRQDRVSRLLAAAGWTELTRVLGASSLTRKTPRSSWTNGRKDCVSLPRGCHRGVFAFDSSGLPAQHCWLQLYRRTAGC
jgi:hypothetical protein